MVDKDKWTIEDIIDRGNRLADILIKKYHIDPVVDPKIIFENFDKISVSDPSAAIGRKPVSFTLEGSNYSVKTFKDITIKLITILDQDDSSRLRISWTELKGNFDKPNSNIVSLYATKKIHDKLKVALMLKL